MQEAWPPDDPYINLQLIKFVVMDIGEVGNRFEQYFIYFLICLFLDSKSTDKENKLHLMLLSEYEIVEFFCFCFSKLQLETG